MSDTPPDMEPGQDQMEHLAEDVSIDEDELRDQVGDTPSSRDGERAGRPDDVPTRRAGAD